MLLPEIIARFCFDIAYEGEKERDERAEGRRRSGSRNSLSSTGRKNGSSFTKELVRFFPGQAFRYRGKSERKTKLCAFALGSIGGKKKKKKVVIGNGFSYTFLRFFFYTKSARFHSIYFVLILRKQRDFNKF